MPNSNHLVGTSRWVELYPATGNYGDIDNTSQAVRYARLIRLPQKVECAVLWPL